MSKEIDPDQKSKKQNNETSIEKTIEVPDVIKTKLIETSIIVFDYDDGTFLYGSGRYFGKPIGIRKPKTNTYFNCPLELSFIEAYYLLSKGKIEVFNPKIERNLTLDELSEHAIKYYDNFIDKYDIYEDLRDKGWIVRPGLKFGADFAVYEKGPGLDHSPYIIQIMAKTVKLSAIDIVRAGRLANSVKKDFIIANALTRTYYRFNWFKP